MHSIATTNNDLRYGYIGFGFDESSKDEDIMQLKAFFEDTRGAFWGHGPEFLGSFSAHWKSSTMRASIPAAWWLPI